MASPKSQRPTPADPLVHRVGPNATGRFLYLIDGVVHSTTQKVYNFVALRGGPSRWIADAWSNHTADALRTNLRKHRKLTSTTRIVPVQIGKIVDVAYVPSTDEAELRAKLVEAATALGRRYVPTSTLAECIRALIVDYDRAMTYAADLENELCLIRHLGVDLGAGDVPQLPSTSEPKSDTDEDQA